MPEIHCVSGEVCFIKREISVLICLCLALCLAFFATVGAEDAAVNDEEVPTALAYAGNCGTDISAQSAALLESQTGTVLYAHNADVPLPMASTTKIMTAAIVLELADLTAEVTIPASVTNIEGSSLYLTAGEVFTVEELLYGLMLESGNDAAAALAVAVAGDIESFVALMNDKAASLGLKSTRFANPHGLTASGHYTTACELARICAYALSIDGFETIVSTTSKRLEGEGHVTRYLTNHNRLLNSYTGMIGVKTGYTAAAGRCLVTAARRDGMTLVAVTLNDRNDWADHRAMLDYGFSAFKLEKVCHNGESVAIPVENGKVKTVFAVCKRDVWLCLPTDVQPEKVYEAEVASAPIKKGQRLAYLNAYANGTLVLRLPMYADSDVKKQRRLLPF